MIRFAERRAYHALAKHEKSRPRSDSRPALTCGPAISCRSSRGRTRTYDTLINSQVL